MRRQAVVLVSWSILLLTGGCGFHGIIYRPTEKPLCPFDSPDEMNFLSADGTALHGWLARSPGATRAILYCHGNNVTVGSTREDVERLRDATGAHVFVFDWRGYGLSGGRPGEEGIQDDAQAALLACERATGLPRSRTVVVGRSLGGAIAIDLVSRKPGVAGLVVVSTFTNIADMVTHFTFMPVFGLVVTEEWDSVAKIPAITCPKLIVHGARDRLVPFVQGERLFTLAEAPKRFLKLEDVGHVPVAHPLFLEELARFVNET